MTRIVTSVARPKRPPKKRKGVALDVPVVVTAKRSRHPLPEKQAAAEGGETSCPNPGAAQPGTPNKAARCPTPTGDDQKPVIVTSISRKRGRQRSAGYTPAEPGDAPDHDPHQPDEPTPAANSTSDALMKAMARMMRPPRAD